MAKITFIENTRAILEVTFEPKEVCPLNDCQYEPCAGKDNRRDREFTCNLRVLRMMLQRR